MQQQYHQGYNPYYGGGGGLPMQQQQQQQPQPGGYMGGSMGGTGYYAGTTTGGPGAGQLVQQRTEELSKAVREKWGQGKVHIYASRSMFTCLPFSFCAHYENGRRHERLRCSSRIR
jgi:hypothetical protein